MGSFQGDVLGALLTLLGWDGSAFRNVKVDASGDLQIDVLSSALPAGAATAEKQNTAATLLGQIDGLRAALNDVGTDELRVLPAQYGVTWQALLQNVSGYLLVESMASALPDGAATEESLQGIEDEVKDTLLNLKSGLYDRKTPTTTAGTYVYYSTAVPAGEVWHLTQIASVNSTRVLTGVFYGVYRSSLPSYFYHNASPVQSSPDTWNGHLWLDEGDQIQVVLNGAGAGDTQVSLFSGHILTV